MQIRPDFERIRKTVKHQEPDRVPLIEVLVDWSVMSRFLGREVRREDIVSQVEFWTNAGYDYVPLVLGMMTPGRVTRDSKISSVLQESAGAGDHGDESWNLEYTSFIHDRNDFDMFPWDAAADIDISQLRTIKELLPDGMKVIAISGKIFTLTTMLMGFDNFCVSLLTDEQLVADIMQKIADIQYSAIAQVIEMPYVGGIWAVDDIAFNSGTMISPQTLRDFVFPHYKKIADKCHSHDGLFFYHSDGNLFSVLDDLISLGVDAIHPIDPNAHDIWEVKARYGDKICLCGNISTELLQNGSPIEVEELVKERLRTIGPGGGYCLGSGNSVPGWAKQENYDAMRETVLKYGVYPLDV